MPWLESHTVLIRHRKLKELALALRLRPSHTMGHLHALWHAALEQQEDGDLSQWSDEIIAEASDFPGDAPQYVRLLQDKGWIDGKLIHDWLEYAGRYLESKYRTRNPRRLAEIWSKHGLVYPRSDSGQTPDSPQDITGPDIPDKDTNTVAVPFASLLKAWNDNRGTLAAVSELTDKRKQKLRLRWRQRPDMGYWSDVVKRIAKSPFCNGHGERGWFADFDWLITNDTNHVRVMEGKYDDRRSPKAAAPFPQYKEQRPSEDEVMSGEDFGAIKAALPKAKDIPK